jgi:pilus assembly protein CpaC
MQIFDGSWQLFSTKEPTMTSAYTTELRRLRRATNGRPAITAALVVAIIVILVAAPKAQQPAPAFAASTAAPAAAAATMTDAPTDVDLLVGRSTVLNIGATIARVSLTVPDIADAMVTAPTQLLIHGKQPGTISLFVWDRAGAIKTFEVKVRRDLTPLIAHIKQLFPGETIAVIGSGKDVVISGTVSSKYVIEKAADVAAGYVDKKENVVNLLKQQEGVASNQVMLRVRFAEVSRNALQELGGSLFSDGNNNQFGRVTTQQFPAPFFDQQSPMLGKTLVFSDYLNLFLFDAKNQIGAVVKALQGKGVFQSLAEPNLIALNGKEASFLAGGEFPYPIPQGNFGAFTIQFKEYGVRLNFTPTVLGGDLINLKIKPEVSSLDFNNAVVIEGFRIPALSTRRADTEIELRDGQTFAIAGLMNNTALSSMRKVPGLGDIPILGTLFKSRAYQKEQSELVVMVTPIIVRRDAPGVSEGLPSLVEPFLGAPSKTIPQPDAYVGSPRYTPKSKAPEPAPAPAPAPSASKPVETPAAVPSQSAAPVQSRQILEALQQSATAPEPAPEAAPAQGQPLTKQQLKALEQAREDERKAAEQAKADDDKAAEQQRKADAAAQKDRVEQEKRDAKRRAEEERKAEELKKQASKLELERQKREAEVAKKNAEQSRKQNEEEQKRQKSLTEAAERLKQAQDAYQAEMSKSSSKGTK